MAYSLLAKRAKLIEKNSKFKSKLPSLVFMTDCIKIDNVFSVVRSLPPNTLIIIRDYNIKNRKQYSQKIIKIAQRRGNKILIAKDFEMAKDLGANGVHLPEHIAYKAKKIKKYNSNLIVTTSAHNKKSIKESNLLPVDAVFLSPIFRTTSHNKTKNKGLCFLRNMQRLSTKPIFALGGVNVKNTLSLRNCGIKGFASIDAFKQS